MRKSLQNFQMLQIKSQLKNPFTNNSLTWVNGIARTLNCASQPVKKEELCFHLSTRQVRKRVSCAAFVVLSADSGLVARGEAPFLCSFLEIEISTFLKDLLLFYFVVS